MLEETLARWGMTINRSQEAQLVQYASELRTWNERVNLTAIIDDEGITTRHFLDSLACALYWGATPARLIDVGTGAGFPGLPLKILYPELRLTLVESVEKKAAFLRHIVAELGLTHVDVVVARAEVLGHDTAYREQFDVAVARAVADLRVLAEYCLPLCRVGGRFLAPKGGQAQLEIAQAARAITELGGQLRAVASVALPHLEPRLLVIIDKIAPTLADYPRATGIPTKRPL